MKICSHCKLPKEKSEFSRDVSRVDNLQPKCKSCDKEGRIPGGQKEYHKKWRALNPSYPKDNAEKINEKARFRRRLIPSDPFKARINKLKITYGLSWEDFNKLIVKQAGKCAICSDIMIRPNVDHCHRTTEIRGLLCRGCNLSLGGFKDSVKNLKAAITYLQSQ